MADVWTNYMACHPTATCHIAGCCHLANSMSWSHSYVSNCRVQSPAEINVMIMPCIILQGAAIWWIHCHDSRSTCQIAGCSHLPKSTSWSCHIAGCNNSIRHIENRFSPYFILLYCFLKCSLSFRAAVFVSSPIHLFLRKSPFSCTHFGDRQRDRRMDRQTDGQPQRIKPATLSRSVA